MSRIAGVVLTTAAVFLLVVAVMLNSPALFYMSTAMIATIGASRVQAWLSVRGLRFERHAPEVATVGEEVTVDLTVTSDHKLRRPLLQIVDHLPARMVVGGRTPALPIAPAYGQPIATTYKFKPLKRGVYRWQKLTVLGSDALGLITLPREYTANPAELTVLPCPIAVSFELPATAGFGFAETEHGKSRGYGIQPRGVREYQAGDALRYVHWPSTARRGQLLVKEFEVGSHAGMALMFQLTRGTDVGEGARTSLELMCGHAAHVIGWHLRQGVIISLPGLDDSVTASTPYELEQAYLRVLAVLNADSTETLASQIQRLRASLEPGATVCLFLTVAELDLLGAVESLAFGGHQVKAMLYDANAFLPAKSRPRLRSATDGDFVDQLQAHGASVQIAPLWEASA